MTGGTNLNVTLDTINSVIKHDLRPDLIVNRINGSSLINLQILTSNSMFNAPGSIQITGTRRIIGNAQVRTTPTVSRIQFGLGSSSGYAMQFCSKGVGNSAVIDFTDTLNDYLGRILTNYSDNTLRRFCDATAAVTIDSTGIQNYQENTVF